MRSFVTKKDARAAIHHVVTEGHGSAEHFRIRECPRASIDDRGVRATFRPRCASVRTCRPRTRRRAFDLGKPTRYRSAEGSRASTLGGKMGCLLVLLAAFAPRLIVIFAWIARPAYFDAVFSTWVFPLLGVIFLPFTTLMVLLVGDPPGGVHGLEWFWIVLAVLVDLSHYANTYSQRGQVSALGRGSPPPSPPVNR
jgi:hypothetical protein